MTSDIVLERPTLEAYSPDYTCLIAALSICFVIFAAFPVNYNPWRNMFFLLTFDKTNQEISNKQ